MRLLGIRGETPPSCARALPAAVASALACHRKRCALTLGLVAKATMASAVATKSAITLKGSVEIVTEFFGASP